MENRFLSRISALVSAFAILLLVGSPSAKADEITMRINAFGNGPTGSETITGSFQFDTTTGVVSNGSLVGTGLVSEHWDFGPIAGTFSSSPSGLPPTAPPPAGGSYRYNQVFITGSLGDTLPFTWVLDAGGAGGFIPPGGGVIGSPSAGYTDSFGGDFIVPVAAHAPEPPIWMLILVGGLVILAAKWKTLLA